MKFNSTFTLSNCEKVEEDTRSINPRRNGFISCKNCIKLDLGAEDDLGTKIQNKSNQAFDILTNFSKKKYEPIG